MYSKDNTKIETGYPYIGISDEGSNLELIVLFISPNE